MRSTFTKWLKWGYIMLLKNFCHLAVEVVRFCNTSGVIGMTTLIQIDPDIALELVMFRE